MNRRYKGGDPVMFWGKSIGGSVNRELFTDVINKCISVRLYKIF